MPSGEILRRTLAAWPAARQLGQVGRKPITEIGLGEENKSPRLQAIASRLEGATAVPSVCPYCAVGCAQLAYVKDGKLIDIEGDPRSPINQGTLCPKGSATFQLVSNPTRVTRVRYRAPFSDHWEERPLAWAMARIAVLVKETRDATYRATDDGGRHIGQCTGIAHLGGATLDNEENYLIKKVFTGGLGMVWVENQARI
jgi:formate dehydrogenase major subunit